MDYVLQQILVFLPTSHRPDQNHHMYSRFFSDYQRGDPNSGPEAEDGKEKVIEAILSIWIDTTGKDVEAKNRKENQERDDLYDQESNQLQTAFVSVGLDLTLTAQMSSA